MRLLLILPIALLTACGAAPGSPAAAGASSSGAIATATMPTTTTATSTGTSTSAITYQDYINDPTTAQFQSAMSSYFASIQRGYLSAGQGGACIKDEARWISTNSKLIPVYSSFRFSDGLTAIENSNCGRSAMLTAGQLDAAVVSYLAGLPN